MKRRGTGVSPVSQSLPRSEVHATTFDLARLRTELKPFKLHWFPTLRSTNTHAARMRRERRLLAPAVVLTGRQTAGRGRGSNVWQSPRGAMTATFILRAHDTLPPQHVPLVAGLAVLDAAAEFGASGIGIKWPNDLWYDGKKFAGLLCERIDGVDLIGVGINANLATAELSAAVAATTTSLHTAIGRPIDQTSLIACIAKHLRSSLGDPRTSLAAVRPRLQALDVLRGRRVRVTQTGAADVEGIAEGIDSVGRLLVSSAGMTSKIVNGTVRTLL